MDRQRLARSRAATPKALYRNGGGMMTLKNITLGSTESLESNRSHHDGKSVRITASVNPSKLLVGVVSKMVGYLSYP